MNIFKKKRIKVQDYPDPSFWITMYGESKTCRFKLGDKVVNINSKRCGCSVKTIIGFDEDGDPYLSDGNCSNTRGGYIASGLVTSNEFNSLFENRGKCFLDADMGYIKELNEKYDRLVTTERIKKIIWTHTAQEWDLVKSGDIDKYKQSIRSMYLVR